MSTTPIVLPPHLFRPPDGISFDYTAYVALPAIGANIAVISFQVPEGFMGVIQRIGNVYVGTGFVDGSGTIKWQIQADGGVIRNYDNMLASLGSVQAPSRISGIDIFEQQTITLVNFNVSLAVGGAQVGGRLSGYFYPKILGSESIWS